MAQLWRTNVEEIWRPASRRPGTGVAPIGVMEKRRHPNDTPEPKGPEGVPVDAPGNDGPAISPHAVSRTHRAEDDDKAREHSPDFHDEFLKPQE